MPRILKVCLVLLSSIAGVFPALVVAESPFQPLFPREGIPVDWEVRHWSDVAKPPPEGAVWRVDQGILHGSTPRGTWLVSKREFGDFLLELEFLLGDQGNSGVGLRFPPQGDPAFDGLELQIVDRRYYGDSDPDADELTGSIYKAASPRRQVYRPGEWNRYEITCRGSRLKVVLNGVTIQDLDLDKETESLERGSPLSARPRRGGIGFQELSRGGGHVQIRNARIKELK